MNKKIGFWHWLILSPIRIAKWILGIGKEKMNGDIIDRVGVIAIVYEILALFCIELWLVWSGNIYDTALTMYLILGVGIAPPVLTLVVLFIYLKYLEEMKDAK